MTGGPGADRFVFRNAGESLPATPDTITDFERGADRIDLSAIAGLSFIGNAAFSAPGQLRFTASGGVGRLEVNTAGIAGAEMLVLLTGVGALTAADLIL